MDVSRRFNLKSIFVVMDVVFNYGMNLFDYCSVYLYK